ncbi:xyloglucan:xyloglucosyl transferase [Marchantia polymorpha subsp. ruderalis]|uniref:Xyloglucan endotransglucosylase/hydrolase n=2 Tax=Marchantia polymorpha TaxID=3197 RepID=A0A176VJ05_MARPO|nr:hypothetical protein AXG93_4888s1090 [Marchantia polymorpha subsp. ruderalis]PTQ32876.1 hypothetical protein MARPO_0094s0050 [Marchantia polymorpha]BBN02750.1 hypothetical protein Mp_2g17820 [Marchantia polymorpha subsp. ruderalis]|eukprot:PTQ32876.1 hypothetical protein MARPO_0094s0050 [Marchantia polymorpha]
MAMGLFGSPRLFLACSIAVLLFGSCLAAFNDEFTKVWTPEHVVPDDASNGVKLMLTEVAGAQFATINSYLYGSFSIKLKLIAGESAGTVCSFYLTSYGANHDEIDFEFLGNETGQPYVLHTNVFANGVGSREQRIFLWFDPTADFHTYSVVWNHKQITWLVDDTPIRIYKNIESVLPNSYPTKQPQVVAMSIFDASTWATRGGAVPAKWEHAPFEVNYRDFSFQACKVLNNDVNSCTRNYEGNWWESAENQSLNPTRASQLKNVHQNYMVYDYCTDRTRYPTAPVECSYNSL